MSHRAMPRRQGGTAGQLQKGIDAVARALEGLVDGGDLPIREGFPDVLGNPVEERALPLNGVFVTWHFLRSFMIPPLFFPNPTA